MDSHSRSASPREPIRPQHRPPSPPSSPAAFDNRAYQHDESDPNHNDSFTSNGPQQNGHTKEPNGETKTLEAVNLELINLTPKNGNAKKKDVEVDMNASNPYDEYFVPVNEHRKYMRGEKLYVTADKRGEKGGCKRPLCWTLLGLVVAAVVAVIVLAATGILFTNSPTTLEQYNTSISSARALGGIAHDHAHDHHDHHDHDHMDHDHQEHTMPPSTEHGPETQNDEAHEHVMGSDESDSSLYVPRTVEGELKIDNEEFTPMLQDPESNEYKEFVSTFTEGLKRAIFDKNTLDHGGDDISVEVIHLREGSVIVTYRIHWKPKMNIQPSEDLLTPKTLEMKLENYLDRYDRMISKYHVAEDKMVARPVLDICQINQNDCEHGCEFDEHTLDFICTCPTGLILDMTNPKKCMSILEHPANDMQTTHMHSDKESQVPTTDSNTHTMQPTPHDDKPADTENTHEHHHTFDWTETHHMMPVTTTESDADVNFSHIFGSGNLDTQTENIDDKHNTEHHSNSEHDMEPKPEPEPEPEPTSEPHAREEPQPSAEPQPASEPEPNAEPKPVEDHQPIPQAEPTPEPEPTAEPEPAAEPHPTAEPQPTEPKVMPELLPTPEPQPAEEPHSEEAQPTEEPQPEHQHNLYSHEEMDAQPKTNSEPKPEPEPTSEPHAETVDRNEEHDHRIHMIESEDEPAAEPQPNAEPEPRTESELDAEHHSEMHTTNKPQEFGMHEHEENAGESTGRALDQENNVTSEENPLNIDDNAEAKPTTASSLEVTTTRISISEPNIINEPSYEPKPEIISILNDNNERTNGAVLTNSNTNESTTNNEWLENNTETNMKEETAETEDEKRSGSNFESEMDAIIKNLTAHNENESESRAFKNIDSEIVAETTTKSSYKSEEENPIDLITKENEVSVTESIGKVEEESTKPIISLHSDIDINEPEKEKDLKENDATEITTTMASFEQKHEQTTMASEDKVEGTGDNATQKQDGELNKESKITSLIEEAKMLDSTTVKPIQTTTLAQEIVTEYSIITSHQNQDTGADKQLIDALENKTHKEVNETSSESNDLPDENTDITFDALNMLFNRSSKSIETHNKTGSVVPETNNNISDMEGTTTESDWLSESVTETNYNEAMNKMEKHDTTETTITKMDDIMNRELTKDDFEPDYLNNMGSSNKPSEPEEPAYGMVHDYDNEDSRVKRVHTEMTTEMIANEISNSHAQEIITEASPATSVPIETTTVSEYIYKSSERVTNQPEDDTIKQNSNESIMSIISHEPVVTAAPAPVWEESEGDKELTVKELMTKENNDITTIRPVSIDDIIVPTTTPTMTTTTTPEPTTVNPAPTTTMQAAMITDNKVADVNDNESTMTETQNATQVKNLNVTIYEISNHNNATLPSPKTNTANSAEYEDHETEMNPFLPEVENNKSLVKKLQEGHNIEPTNLNEMQNDNGEEHSGASEGHASSDDSLAVLAKGADESGTTTTYLTTTESDTSFNELLMHVSPQVNDTEPPRTNAPEITTKSMELVSMEENNRMAKAHDKEILPVSSFLMDTDDLDAYKPTVTKIIPERDNTVTPVPASINSDSEYLSVVPIEEERKEEDEALKGNYQKDNIQELNDISDSPKKSDRRTLDETKFDSVITNEA